MSFSSIVGAVAMFVVVAYASFVLTMVIADATFARGMGLGGLPLMFICGGVVVGVELVAFLLWLGGQLS